MLGLKFYGNNFLTKLIYLTLTNANMHIKLN